MRKIIITRPGGYGRLQIKEVSMPTPKDNQVLVAVSAAGVNFADIFVRLGLYKPGKDLVGWPITPGFEFAGHVMKCGPDVAGFEPDMPVLGVTRFGGYATHVCVPMSQIYPIAANSKFTSDQWAAFPAVFLSAYYGLFHNIVLRPDMQILVHSAAGGVGGALLQLGNIAGCRMIGVVGASHKVDVTQELGARKVIDKSRQNLWEQARHICPQGFDVIFDANGPATLKQSYQYLAPSGKLVAYGFHSMLSIHFGVANYLKLIWQYFRVPRFSPLKMTRDNRSLIAFNLAYLFDRTDLLQESMQTLIQWVEQGKIKPPPVHAYAFKDVAQAHQALESGTTVGKLILKINTQG